MVIVQDAQIDIIEEFWAIELFILLKEIIIMSVNKGQSNDFGHKSGFFLDFDQNIVGCCLI